MNQPKNRTRSPVAVASALLGFGLLVGCPSVSELTSALTATPAAPPGPSAIGYDFEADTVGAAPSQITLLGGDGSGTPMLVVTDQGPSGSIGKVIHDSSASQRSSPAVGRLDLWGDPKTNDQVMEWRRWTSSSTAVNIDGVLLRSQAGTTLGPSPGYAGLTQGYFFKVDQQGGKLEIDKLASGAVTPLGNQPLAVGTFTRFRASALGSRLRFETSADGLVWTTRVDVTDPTFPLATGRPLYVNGFDSWNPDTAYVDGFTLTAFLVKVVPVVSVTLGSAVLTGAQGTTRPLTWTVTPADATYPKVTFTSDDRSIADVNAAGLVSFVSPGTCTITAQGTSGTGSKVLVHTTDATGKVPSMRVGVNLWNKNWEPDDTYFNASAIDPAHPEVWAAPGFNPWRTEFLGDLALFNGPIRFMDMIDANGSAIEHWADRYPATYPQFQSWFSWWGQHSPGGLVDIIPIDPALLAIPEVAGYYTAGGTLSTTYQLGELSYEWMIDLCNRTGRDLWINVPAFADADYMTKLATLIRDTLNPDLKVYVEYSNEFWNYISVATAYSYHQGPALGLPGENQYYQGTAWCVYQALKVFRAFEDVFGTANTGYGKRLTKVLAYSSNSDLLKQAFDKVVYSGGPGTGFNATWNAGGEKPDVLAIAPYIGPDDPINGGKLDGADPAIAAKYRAAVDWTMTHYVQPFRALAQAYGLPLVTYEGGQQLDTNAGTWSSNPLIYAEYQHFLDQLNANGLQLFNHYTLYGDYGPGGAWGLKSGPAQPNTTAGGSPKYQAVHDWLAANPNTVSRSLGSRD